MQVSNHVHVPKVSANATFPPPDRTASAREGTCLEAWRGTPWPTRGGNKTTRVCTDANGCDTAANKPSESTTLPALDDNFYRCNVEPIFDEK